MAKWEDVKKQRQSKIIASNTKVTLPSNDFAKLETLFMAELMRLCDILRLSIVKAKVTGKPEDIQKAARTAAAFASQIMINSFRYMDLLYRTIRGEDQEAAKRIYNDMLLNRGKGNAKSQESRSGEGRSLVP